MSLQQKLMRGDWITAAAQNGSIIRGQAAHDMNTIGFSALTIVVAGDGNDEPQDITINCNYWDVTVTMANLLTQGETR